MSEDPQPNLSKADADDLANLLAAGLRRPFSMPDDALPPSAAADSSMTDVSGVTRSLFPSVEIAGYAIVREIGRGGMGRVFEAVQLSTHRHVALKVMLEGPLAGEHAKHRFEREVRIVAGLRHPNIAQVYESGLHQGRYWYSMELVEGQPLDAAAAGLPLEKRLGLMATVCETIGFAHEQGIVHRDLKPSNILVSTDGHPRVLDFGLAKVHGGQHTQNLTLSTPGELMGTPAYMSPEQTGPDATEVGAQSDVYSLGVIMYRLVTGHFPYDVHGRLDELIRQINSTAPTPPSRVFPGIDAETEAVLLKALAKDPAARYPSAAAFAADIRRRLAGARVEARLPSRLSRLTHALPRWRRLLVALAVLIGGVAVGWLWFARGSASVQPGARAANTSRIESENLAQVAVQTVGGLKVVEKASLPKAPGTFAAAWVEGKLHVVGGDSDCQAWPDHFVYDPSQDEWTTAAALLTPRLDCSAIAVAGKLLVVGGQAGCNTPWLASAELYDPAADTWTPCAPLPVALNRPALAGVGGRAYVLGGNITSTDPYTFNRDTYVYDVAADAWSTGGRFRALADRQDISNSRNAVTQGTDIHLLWGARDLAQWPNAFLYTYDTRGGTWNQRAALPIEICTLALADLALTTVKDHLALLSMEEIEGRTRLWLKPPAGSAWYPVDTVDLSYGDASAVRVAESGGGLFVLGGILRESRCDRVRYVDCTRPLAELRASLRREDQETLLFDGTFTGHGTLGAPWETYLGSWQVAEGRLDIGFEEPQKWAYAVLTGAKWTDYALECEFRHDSAKLAFLFRVDWERGTYYRVALQHEEQDEAGCHDAPEARLDRRFFRPTREPGAARHSVRGSYDHCLYAVPRGRYCRLRIEAQGPRLRVFLDDECVLVGEDLLPDALLSGGIAFAVETGCFRPAGAAIRNVRILELAP